MTIDPPLSHGEPAPDTPADLRESNRLWFKEIITALLALATLVSMLAFYAMLSKLPDETRYRDGSPAAVAAAERNSGFVEKAATALFAIFAAFVGYYAGRVPAERAVSDARGVARDAQRLTRQSQIGAAQAQENASENRRRLSEERAAAAALLRKTLPFLGSTNRENDEPARDVAAEVDQYVRSRSA